MNESCWQKVCPSDQLLLGQQQTLQWQKTTIAVFHTSEGVFAIDNQCPHKGADLHPGRIDRGVIHCPWHDWAFRLKDGLCLFHKGFSITSFPVKLEANHWWVDVDNGTNQANRQ